MEGSRPRYGSVQKLRIGIQEAKKFRIRIRTRIRNTAFLRLSVEWDVFRELEEAKNDESFLDEECEDRWTEADKRLMGPLLGKKYLQSIVADLECLSRIRFFPYLIQG
jgi:hypothetical protein